MLNITNDKAPSYTHFSTLWWLSPSHIQIFL